MIEYNSSTALLPRIGRYVSLLTAKTEEMDKIAGLSVGVQVYLTTPFSPRELAARVKAVVEAHRSGNRFRLRKKHAVFQACPN